MKKTVSTFIIYFIILCIGNIGLCENKSKKVQMSNFRCKTIYTYKNYIWGKKKSEIKKLVKDNGYKIDREKKSEVLGQYVIRYDDNIYTKNDVVKLCFTAITKKLYSVRIFSWNVDNTMKIIKTLEKELGNYKVDITNNYTMCIWRINNISVKLYISDKDVSIFYTSNHYKKLWKKEKNDIKGFR